MKCASLLCLFGNFLALTASAATPPTKFEVAHLPGYVEPNGKPKDLPSRFFTGYLDAGTPPSGSGTMYFHYWMVESENDPANDPVIVWYNGGPGASSLFGLLQEFGPLLITEDSYDASYEKTGVPSPQLNPFRWSLNYTLVTIDSPPPIGLSYCSDAGPSGPPTSCGAWTDKSVFAANHAAHRTFFERVFPEFKSNPVFFAGESYAGIYVPGFIEAMLDDPIEGLNLAGFAVGDGWTGCAAEHGRPVDWCINLDNVGIFKYPNVYPGPKYDVEFFHGHSQFSEELYRDIHRDCSTLELDGVVTLGGKCASLIDEMAVQVGYFYPYHLLNACPVSGDSGVLKGINKHGMNQALAARRTMAAQVSGKKHYSGLSSPCIGNALDEWFNKDTLTAIGAFPDSNFINLDNGHGFNYSSDQTFVGPIYERALHNGLRVMIFEGDNDACGLQTAQVEDIFVPLFKNAGLEKTQHWRPWTTDGKTEQAGFSIVWDKGKAMFVSVRGAGHMVPLNRPQAALVMMNAFTQHHTLPPYIAPSHNKEYL